MTRRCSVHGGDVPDREAQLLDPADVAITGPGAAPRYACRTCVRANDMVPLAEYRLDTPTVTPGAAA